MTEIAPTAPGLAARLRELRGSVDGAPITQKQLADALGISPALVSSWESGAAIPPEDRLKKYARFFATGRSAEGGTARLIPADELLPAEERRREELTNELVRLRIEALRPAEQAGTRRVGAVGGRFWYFPDGRDVTILYTPFSARQLGLAGGGRPDPAAPPVVGYATPTHPNRVASLRNADMDAVIELVGHIRAENPRIEVRWLAYDEVTTSDQLTGHLVILGGGDAGLIASGVGENPVRWFVRRLELPVQMRLPQGGDDEFDTEFVIATDDDGTPGYDGVRQEVYRPRFLRDERREGRPRVLVDGSPQLEYDVALLARQPNPLNLAARITLCSGIFSRGTYGVVRALTDARFREQNEQYLEDAFGEDLESFWILLQVPVFGPETITPDLHRPFLRLRESA